MIVFSKAQGVLDISSDAGIGTMVIEVLEAQQRALTVVSYSKSYDESVNQQLEDEFLGRTFRNIEDLSVKLWNLEQARA